MKVLGNKNSRECRDTSFLNFKRKHYTTLMHWYLLIKWMCWVKALTYSWHNLNSNQLCILSKIILGEVENILGETALSVIYTSNRIPSLVINHQTPYECLIRISPNYEIFSLWLCYFVQLQSHGHIKVEPRAQLYCFLAMVLNIWIHLFILWCLWMFHSIVYWRKLCFLYVLLNTLSSIPFFTYPSVELFPMDSQNELSCAPDQALKPNFVLPIKLPDTLEPYKILLKALFLLLILLSVWLDCENPLFDYESLVVFSQLSIDTSLVIIMRLMLTLFGSKLSQRVVGSYKRTTLGMKVPLQN